MRTLKDSDLCNNALPAQPISHAGHTVVYVDKVCVLKPEAHCPLV